MSETDNVSFGEIIRALIFCLRKVSSKEIVNRPSWIDDVLDIDPESWTFNTITPAMQKEFSAVMDLSSSRLEIEQEELAEELKELQLRIDEVASDINNIAKLKDGAVACFGDLEDLKEQLI